MRQARRGGGVQDMPQAQRGGGMQDMRQAAHVSGGRRRDVGAAESSSEEQPLGDDGQHKTTAASWHCLAAFHRYNRWARQRVATRSSLFAMMQCKTAAGARVIEQQRAAQDCQQEEQGQADERRRVYQLYFTSMEEAL
ncbi:hypothetical protein GOP47_0018733 [Adiantum capillus-veneris]|uniref:Uncharacterized protein n=1 Tax=Adiantum capillus-veneris TaxID=13818 RepID=A0A9D4UDR3_ADICA|nr:hypothetical protein GOP47_0018733 [Adiantum capillus-veneris]